MAPSLRIAADLDPNPCLAALIWAEGIQPPAPSTELPAPLAELVARAEVQGEALWAPGVKKRVRDLLRHGKYKPSGRSKPASEFLLKAAQKGQFPAINPPVDCNNYVSLASGLPGTIFDTDLSGERLILRWGRPAERYVFNVSGQEIDLQDLLLLARETPEAPEIGIPCGNPVKDSMDTKIRPDQTSRVVAVLYAPADEPREQLERWAREFEQRLRQWCGAVETGVELIGA